MINSFFVTIISVFLILQTVQAQKTKYVVIAVLDGARYTETFGDSSHEFVQRMWNELKPQGTIYTHFYNNGKTETNPGHASILSGTWQYIANDGSEYSHNPSIFEYLRKEKNIPESECWVALGKDKLNVLARSTHQEYGIPYASSVRTSTDPSDDALTYGNVLYVLTNHRSRITIANFAKIDIEGHAGSWENYSNGIKRADTLMSSLWNAIQSDGELKNKTSLIITNDHGRHTTDFVNHGDGCEGCRHLMLMILGPDTPKGLTDTTLYSQIDIAPTIGKMMRFSTPLAQGKVIESAISAAANVSLKLKNEPTIKLSGLYDIQWSVGAVQETISTIIEYSKNGGDSWQTILHTISRDSLLHWDTQTVPDGTRYRIRIHVLGDTTYGIVQSSQNFTIDNPGNGAPDVVLLSQNRNLILSGTQKIAWNASDADGDTVTISVKGSTDNGTTWTSIEESLSNSGSYNWDTSPQANSKFFRIKVIGSDGQAATESISPIVEVQNIRQKIHSLTQSSGSGNGIVSVNISDPSQLTGDLYRINFKTGIGTLKQYIVENITKNSPVLQNVPFTGDGSEGPLFDGLRLAITDYPEPIHNKDSTRWLNGVSTVFTKVNLPELVLPGGNIQATPEAADYEIRISDVVVDTSKDYFGATPTPLYYTVFNATLQRKTPIVLTEFIPDGKISFGDDLYLFRKDSADKDVLSWEIFINGDENSINPQPGDVYLVATSKPITFHDVFEFTANVTSVKDVRTVPEHFLISQNYPNPFNPTTSFLLSIPIASNVSVKVFDLLGREVWTVVDGVLIPGTHHYQWNASAFASGIYIYRMKATPRNSESQFYTQVKKMIFLK